MSPGSQKEIESSVWNKGWSGVGVGGEGTGRWGRAGRGGSWNVPTGIPTPAPLPPCWVTSGKVFHLSSIQFLYLSNGGNSAKLGRVAVERNRITDVKDLA